MHQTVSSGSLYRRAHPTCTFSASSWPGQFIPRVVSQHHQPKIPLPHLTPVLALTMTPSQEANADKKADKIKDEGDQKGLSEEARAAKIKAEDGQKEPDLNEAKEVALGAEGKVENKAEKVPDPNPTKFLALSLAPAPS